MRLISRINLLLNHRIDIKINFNQRISRTKALVFIAVLAVMMVLSGYYIGERWYWVKDQNLYEYRIEYLKKQLTQNPKSNNIRAELGMTYFLNSQVNKAEAMLRDVLEDEPENDIAVLYLGLILSEQKDYYKSIELLNRYLKINQGLETRVALLYLGRDYLETEAYDLALTTLRKAVERDPANPVVWYYLGQAYENVNDRKNAISAYERALVLNKNYTEAEWALNSLAKQKPAGSD
ncbi:tetratricopeptide repeat protein [Phosphitispora sp. TUW77]|uniref:tetratricopeptide repeat protein n=1 Tax=Phosphitispora sp. TUW77 TaxID=3152361 RepID=UPI003AB4B916